MDRLVHLGPIQDRYTTLSLDASWVSELLHAMLEHRTTNPSQEELAAFLRQVRLGQSPELYLDGWTVSWYSQERRLQVNSHDDLSGIELQVIAMMVREHARSLNCSVGNHHIAYTTT